LQLPARVEEINLLSPRMRQITLRPAVTGLAWVPGQHVQVQVGARPGPLEMLTGLHRTYTVWDYNGFTLQLCVFDHGHGPGAQWAGQAALGEEVLITRPQGEFVLRAGPYHLFAGEETASVAYGAMLRNHPDIEAHVVVEIDRPEDALVLPGAVRWQYRHGAPAAGSASLLETVRHLELPAEPGVAYLASPHHPDDPVIPGQRTAVAPPVRAHQAVLDVRRGRTGVTRDVRARAGPLLRRVGLRPRGSWSGSRLGITASV
jgi:NADPH-dependent ferric siderophore reductase